MLWHDATDASRGDSAKVRIPVAFTAEFRVAGADGAKGAQVTAYVRALRIADAEWRFNLLTFHPEDTENLERGFTGTVLSEDWFTGKGGYSHVFENRVLRKGETVAGYPRLLMGWDYDCFTVPVWACVDEYCRLRDRNVCDWVYFDNPGEISNEEEAPSDGGGGSSGGSGDAPSPIPIPLDIDDELDEFPCAQALVAQLTTLDNGLAKLLDEIFGESKNFNVNFESSNLLDDNVDGIETGQGLSSDHWGSPTYESTIQLNTFILENATKEYILVTMYHEAIHSYLRAKQNQLGTVAFNTKYPEITEYEYTYGNGKRTRKYEIDQNHTRFAIYVDALSDAIRSFNPNMPFASARAMAKMGIVAGPSLSNAEKLLNGNERDVSKGNSKGTKCIQ